LAEDLQATTNNLHWFEKEAVTFFWLSLPTIKVAFCIKIRRGLPASSGFSWNSTATWQGLWESTNVQE
jgi:hypothetical protein